MIGFTSTGGFGVVVGIWGEVMVFWFCMRLWMLKAFEDRFWMMADFISLLYWIFLAELEMGYELG